MLQAQAAIEQNKFWITPFSPACQDTQRSHSSNWDRRVQCISKMVSTTHQSSVSRSRNPTSFSFWVREAITFRAASVFQSISMTSKYGSEACLHHLLRGRSFVPEFVERLPLTAVICDSKEWCLEVCFPCVPKRLELWRVHDSFRVPKRIASVNSLKS